MTVTGHREHRICGADFSGALKPARGSITYVCGRLRGTELFLEPPRPCEDRLDLFAAVLERPALWGLDFPFALPAVLAAEMGRAGGPAQWAWARDGSRGEVLAALEERAGRCNGHMAGGGERCLRATDRAAGGQSPLKRTNPDMAAMTFAGLRFLAYLKQAGVSVFPFDGGPLGEAGGVSRVAEVYPGWLWRRLGMLSRQEKSVAALVHGVGRGTPALRVRDLAPGNGLSDHDRDAVAGCVTLALAVVGGVARDGPGEEERRDREGLIVRPAGFSPGAANG
jgi:hypothetical protein